MPGGGLHRSAVEPVRGTRGQRTGRVGSVPHGDSTSRAVGRAKSPRSAGGGSGRREGGSARGAQAALTGWGIPYKHPTPHSDQHAALHVPLQDDTMDAAAPPGAPEQDEAEWRAARAAWIRIRRAGLPREQHGLAYGILHGSLYVNSFLCHIGLLPAHAAYCECADCQPVCVLESLSHAFLRCPAVAPAAAWVCSVFAAVSGGAAPPCCPRVLLGDEHAVWRPEPSLQHCWTHLRVSFLHSVWQLRARRSRAGRPFCPPPFAQPPWRRSGQRSSATGCGRRQTSVASRAPTLSGSAAATSTSP